MTTDPDAIISKAEERAAKMVDEARREATIRKALKAEYPHIPQPRSVFFSGAYKGRHPEVWLTWELPEEVYDPDDHTTPGGFFREARRIIEAFDWQTIVIKKDGCTTVGPEAGVDYDADDDVTTVDGLELEMDNGKGYGPIVTLTAWTELPQLLNEGWFRIKVKLHGRGLPQMPLARVEERHQGAGRPIIREKVYPRIDHACSVVRWWSTEDSIRVSYFMESDDWQHFADLQQAEMGD
jgi:hypothetical protein